MVDWIPPRTFFSPTTTDDMASWSVAGFDSVNRSGPPFTDHNSTTQASLVGPRSSTRVGLVERMAARAGFNAPRLNTESIRSPELYTNTGVRSPYLTIPPGLSPTTLLESPVFLSNSMAQPSPTTGKFPYFLSGSGRDLESMIGDCGEEGEENTSEDNNASPFGFIPITESTPPTRLNSTSRTLPSVDLSFHSEQNIYPPKFNSENKTVLSPSLTDDSPPLADDSLADDSPPSDEQQQYEDVDQRAGDQYPNNGDGGSAMDSYNWKKYGQKHVKGSEYPRSYYKCTHQNCHVKKKVERSHEGHVTEIIYKRAHNHSKPPLNSRPVPGPASTLGDMQLDSEQLGPCETGDDVEESLNISNNNDDDRAAHGSVSLGYEGEGDESESKRRRIENYTPEMMGATRAIREPRVVVQTKSDVDILDDGYRWRKYGQKVVKGNPNPRSYYKCTSPGCNVRKHVERASHDLKSVITTYEGKHNHIVPAARGPNTQQAPVSTNHVHRPDPCPVRGRSAWFERPLLASFGLPGRQQVGPGFGFGMSQHSPSILGLAAGLGPHQGKLPVLPVHTYAGNRARPPNEMAYMLPEEELKSEEPAMDSGLNSAVGSSAYYQQLMSRLPLGHRCNF